MNLKVGDVFRWIDFPDPRGGPIKPRWFVYLGETGSLSQVAFAYLSTTTTTLDDFKAGGKRSLHDHHVFKKEEVTFFDEDCVIDYEERPHTVKISKLETHLADIEPKGKLPTDKLRMIYKRVLKSDNYSKSILNDIHDSFNRSGIMGLRRP